MAVRDALGPFQPGPGGMPPYLAGREPEQELFRALLHRLSEKAPLPSEILLYGPRGNGKTVLLRWLENEAAASGIQTAVLLPSETPDGERLVELLRPSRWWHRILPGHLGVGGVSWAGRTDGIASESVSAILAKRARDAPLLLMMDEAHTLDLKVGRTLLNASQRVREMEPFLLVFAGTPNLEGRLGRMGASFWDRARQVRIGRLDERATREAFRRPFEAADLHVEDSVLPEIVRLSHGYPYFVQLLGQSVWNVTPGDEGDRVTPATLAAALPAFEATKGRYYHHRYIELRDRRLLGVGRSVAALFAGRETVSDQMLTQAIRSGLEDSSHEEAIRAERVLADLGFIWGTGPNPEWEAGIPSLMDYVAEFAPAP